jgi:hypothetical protein
MSNIETLSELVHKLDKSKLADQEFQERLDRFVENLSSPAKSCSINHYYEAILRNYQAREFAIKYQPSISKINEVDLKNVFEDEPAPSKDYYSFNDLFTEAYDNLDEDTISEIQSKLEQANLYEFETLNNGLIRTSATINAHMRWQWFTDTCMIGSWQRKVSRNDWQKALITNLGIIASNKNDEIINRITWNAELYRYDPTLGIYHVFHPEHIRYNSEGVPDPNSYLESNWFAPKRVEAKGLLLLRLLEELIYVKDHSEYHGSLFDIRNSASKFLLRKVLDNLTRYLLSVNFDRLTGKYDMLAPTNSSWEEVIFDDGGVFDAASITQALILLRKVIELAKTDADWNQFIYHDTAEMKVDLKQVPFYADYYIPETLDNAINSGKELIDSYIISPALNNKIPMQNILRHADTTIFLLTALDYEFDPNPIIDVLIRNKVIKTSIQQLAGKYGFRRYNKFTFNNHQCFDSYLNLDYQLCCEVNELARILTNAPKSGFANIYNNSVHDLGDFLDRQELASFEYSAEWTIGSSAALQAISKSLLKLKNAKVSDAEQENLKRAFLETESISKYLLNLNLAQICGSETETLIRSDGTPLPQKYCVIEAFQAISDMNGAVSWLPGQHTLAWSQSQLLDGIDNLKTYTKNTQLQEAS